MVSAAGKAVLVEDAVALTEFGRFHWALLVMTGMCSASAVMEIVSPSYLLPAAACDLGLSAADKGLLGAVAFIGMIAGTHMWGVLSDTRGRMVVLRVSLLGDAAVAILSAFLPNFPLFAAARFFNGVLVGAPTSSAMAYMGEFHSPKTRAKAFIFMALFPGGATLVLAGVAYSILPLHVAIPLPWVVMRSWRLFVLVNAIPSLLTGSWLFWFPESPRYLVAAGRPDLALRVLARVYSINTGKSPDDFPVGSIMTPGDAVIDKKRSILAIIWEQTVPLLKPPLLKHTALLSLLSFVIVCSCNGLLIWLPEVFNRMSLYDELHPNETVTTCHAIEALSPSAVMSFGDAPELLRSLATRMSYRVTRAADDCDEPVLQDDMFINTATIGVSNIVTAFLGGIIVNIVGKRQLMCASLLLSGVCCLLLNVVVGTAAVLGLACVLISVTSMCLSVLLGMTVEQYPTALRGMAVSLAMMTGRLGSMSGNFTFGFLIETKCSAAFWGLGAILIVSGCLSLLLPRKGAYAN